MIRAVRWAFAIALTLQAIVSLHHEATTLAKFVCAAEICGAVLMMIPAMLRIGAALLVCIFCAAGAFHGGVLAMWLIYPTLLVLLIATLPAEPTTP